MQAGKVLDDMNEKRVEKVNRVRIAEKERNNLQESKAEAELLMAKEREIRQAKNALYQVKLKVAHDSVRELSTKRETDVNYLDAERNKMSESDSILKEKEKAYVEAKDLHDAISQEIKDNLDAFGSLERLDTKLKTDLKHAKEQLKKVEANTARDCAREEDSSNDAKTAQDHVDAAKKSLTDIEEKKVEEEKNLEEIMTNLKETTAELRVELETAQTSLTDAERGISSLQTEKDGVSTSIDLIRSRVKKATENSAKLIKKRNDLKEERKSTESNLKNSEKERKSIESSISELESSIERLADDETNLQARLRDAIAEAEDGKASMASSGSKVSGTFQSIMKATKKGGKLSGAGVKGRLGDLATIDSKYDVAISTACGSLDSIVVETTEGAQACIEFLRATNGGRANFIPLDRMSQWASKMNTGNSFPASRLFDLIVPTNDAYLPAFYQALRDTLVSDTLESATATAFVGNAPKWRVVTLSGELIDISGSMSGGGKTSKSGGMLLSGSASAKMAMKPEADDVVVDIKQLEEAVVAAKKELNECRQSKEEAEDSLKDAHKHLKSLDREVAKMQQFLSKFGSSEEDITCRISELEKDMTMSAEESKEIATLEKKSKEIDQQISDKSPNLVSYRNNVASIQRKILDVGGPKLARAQQRLDILTQQYDQLCTTVSTREVDVSNAKKNVTKFSAARAKGESEVETLTEKYQKVKKQIKEMEEEALSVAEKMESANAKMLEQDAALTKFTLEYQDVKATFAVLEKTIFDAEEVLKETDRLLKLETEVVSAWSTKLGRLRKEHIDEQNDFKMQVQDILAQATESMRTDEAEVSASKPEISIGGTDGDGSSGDDKGRTEAENDDNDDDSDDEDEALKKISIEDLTVFSEEEIEEALANQGNIEGKIETLEEEKEQLKSTVNMNALYQYLRKNAIFVKRMRDLKRVTSRRDALRLEYDDLRNQRLKEFTAGFDIISLKLKEMYQMITLGGDAELELVDSLDPFSEGIVFSVRPPKKSWKNIVNLSGGEKTLSSLALVFALHHYKPTALYVMDEIDAALDFKNVSIVANYIKERTKNAQFVIISLRNNMFELADRLVGIYKTHDCTKSVTINPKAFDEATAGKLAKISAVGNTTTKKRVLADATNVN
jgi:structural maintenance of chromosome 4